MLTMLYVQSWTLDLCPSFLTQGGIEKKVCGRETFTMANLLPRVVVAIADALFLTCVVVLVELRSVCQSLSVVLNVTPPVLHHLLGR